MFFWYLGFRKLFEKFADITAETCVIHPWNWEPQAQSGSKSGLIISFTIHAILINYFLRLIHSSAKQVHFTYGILIKIPKKGPQSTEKQFYRFFWYLGIRKLFDKFADFIAET